eukprot:2147980-Pyramimonas_sp.AAC.1
MGRDTHHARCAQAQAMQNAELEGADPQWPDEDAEDPWAHLGMDDDGTNEASEQRAATPLVHRNEASPASVTPTLTQD